MRAGLHLKSSLLLAALAAVPAIAAGYSVLALAEKNARASAGALHLRSALGLAENLEQRTRQMDRILLWAVGRLDGGLSTPAKRDILRSLLDQDPDNESVSLLNESGKEVLGVSAAGSPTAAAFPPSGDELRACLESEEPLDRLIPLVGGVELARCAPLREGGALYLRVRTLGLERELALQRLGQGGFAMLADRDGHIALAPSVWSGQAAASLAAPAVQEALADQTPGVGRFQDTRGGAWLGAHAPAPSLGVVVFMQQPDDEVIAPYRDLRARFLWILAAALLASLGLGWFFAESVARPLRELISGAEAIASGDFTRQVRLQTGDELQALADAFNRMMVRLREYTEMHLERLVENQERTEAILFSIEDGIILTDYEGHIQLANRSAKSILGRGHEEELAGESLTDLLPDPAVREVLEEVERNPQSHLVREIHITTGLSRRVYQVSSEPVISPKRGRSHGIVTAFHDVTLEKEIERVKDEFVHSITHDLRNPMTALRGFIRFLLNELGGPLTPAQKKMVESMDKASFRLLSMINNILDVAKIDSGKMAVKVKPMSLKEVAARVVEITTPLAVHRGITLSIEGNDPGLLVGDEDLLERVFSNLVGNAVKFTPDGGRVTISLRSDADWVLAAVEDTGEGIPAHYLKRLFEKYQQVEEQRRGGTGLGLAICKFIVEAHLGKIWVESQYGQGSKFSVSLPRNLEQDANGDVRHGAKVKA